MTSFQKSKQVIPFHLGKGKYKTAMKATLLKSEAAASKRTRGKVQLQFSRLGSSLLHWFWAYRIQLSSQIFPPGYRLFCLFQDFIRLQKVLHPEDPPCKPHAVRIWSKPLTLLRDYPGWLQWHQQLQKATAGEEETEYALELALLIVAKQSGHVKRLSKEHTSIIQGSLEKHYQFHEHFTYAGGQKSLTSYLAANIYLILTVVTDMLHFTFQQNS